MTPLIRMITSHWRLGASDHHTPAVLASLNQPAVDHQLDEAGAVARASIAQHYGDSSVMLVRTFIDQVWNHGNLAAIDRLLADNPAGTRMLVRMVHTAIPDLRMTVDHAVLKGDIVYTRWSATGTNTGAWLDLPPTGRPAHWSGHGAWHVADGRIVSVTETWDLGTMLNRLGVR